MTLTLCSAAGCHEHAAERLRSNQLHCVLAAPHVPVQACWPAGLQLCAWPRLRCWGASRCLLDLPVHCMPLQEGVVLLELHPAWCGALVLHGPSCESVAVCQLAGEQRPAEEVPPSVWCISRASVLFFWPLCTLGSRWCGSLQHDSVDQPNDVLPHTQSLHLTGGPSVGEREGASSPFFLAMQTVRGCVCLAGAAGSTGALSRPPALPKKPGILLGSSVAHSAGTATNSQRAGPAQAQTQLSPGFHSQAVI